MNIRELKELIKDLPDEMEVCSRDTKWIREETRVYTYNIFEEDEHDYETVILIVD